MTRTANFTSSSIWKLTTRGRDKKSFGAPAITYIKEKQMELRLGRQLNAEASARPTSWGNLCEDRAFSLIPQLDYKLVNKERLSHPDITNWTGAPDLLTPTIVGDLKCPFTLKSFCQMADCFGDVEALKELVPEYFWQLVSNGILANKSHAELILYVPYKNELKLIKSSVDDYEGNADEVNWVKYANGEQLPYLLEGGHYKNIERFVFEIPKEDKQFLTESVAKAVRVLHGLEII